MEIHTKEERRRLPRPEHLSNTKKSHRERAFAKDYTRACENCGEKPVVYLTGMCGPCTWGESDTADGNW